MNSSLLLNIVSLLCNWFLEHLHLVLPQCILTVHLMVFRRSCGLRSLFFKLFSFSFSDSVIAIIISSSSLILFAACLNLSTFESLYYIFHFSLHFYVPKILFVFVFVVFIFWFFKSLYWYFHLVHMDFFWVSPCLLLVLWAYLRHFLKKSLSNRYSMRSFSVNVSIDLYFSPLEGYIIFCLFVGLVIFFFSFWVEHSMVALNNVVILEIKFSSFSRICCVLF